MVLRNVGDLFGWRWAVKVGPYRFTEFDCSFEVEKSLEKVADTCDLTVHNLPRDAMREIVALNTYVPVRESTKKSEKKKPRQGKIEVVVEAGYINHVAPIFIGSSDYAVISANPPEDSIRVQASDAGRTMMASRVSAALAPGATHLQAVETCISALGLGQGNLRRFAATLAGTTYPMGITLDGVPSKLLSGILRRHKLHYHVAHSSVRIMEAGKSPNERTTGVLLNGDTGLVEQPEINEKGDIIVNTIMIPDLNPGDYIRVESPFISGDYFIHEMRTIGDTAGDKWGHTITARVP